MFESDSSNNTVSKSIKTPINRKARFTMNKSSNRSIKYCENLDNEARQNLCETAKKRIRIICENLDHEKNKKMHKGDQKRKNNL